MSTEIKTIKGSCHVDVKSINFKPVRGKAEISLTRFFNGSKLGPNIQVTIQQHHDNCSISYIHLTKEQCENLAKTLMDCFDYEKYPSD